MTPAFDFPGRVARAREAMVAGAIDVLVLSVGSDLPYLFGYRAMENERLTMAVIPRDDEAILVVPELEVPRVEPRPDVFRVLPWCETQDPVQLVSGAIGAAETVAVGDQTWSRFVLSMQEQLSGVRWISAGPLMESLRLVKEPAETELLRAAGAAVDRVATRLANHRFSGKSERTLAGEIAGMTVEEGSDVATFTIVASGPNAASPHHEPTDREIVSGDAVVVDFGGKVGGYCSDTTRTFSVGEPTAELREVHTVVAEAQASAREAVAPGVACHTVDDVARSVIADAGYGSLFIHRLGHGIGLDGHEPPYLVAGNDQLLESGMAFSIEPGVYLPGRLGVRIEDIAICSPAGLDLCNDSTRDLVIVE